MEVFPGKQESETTLLVGWRMSGVRCRCSMDNGGMRVERKQSSFSGHPSAILPSGQEELATKEELRERQHNFEELHKLPKSAGSVSS